MSNQYIILFCPYTRNTLSSREGTVSISPCSESFFQFTDANRTTFYYKEQATAKSNSFKIAQKIAFEAKRRLYTTGKVIQRLFIIDLYT